MNQEAGCSTPTAPLRPKFGRLSRRLTRHRLRIAARHITGQKVLDAGCNIAQLTDYLPANVQYTGLEIMPEVVELNRRRHPEHRFYRADLDADWPEEVRRQRYDHVVMLAVLEHLSDPARALASAREVLESDGTIVVTTPHPQGRIGHELGARLRLLSSDASEEHEQFLGRDALVAVGYQVGLSLILYQRFLGRLNQLAVYRAAF
jgi:2-polyprenyl-3-methyl-5-hydroxy-6-metoxy-1,4-benzoquinol methylase